MNINHFNADEKILHYSDKINYFINSHRTLIVTELDLTNKCNHRCPGCCGHNENNQELSKEQIAKIAEGLKVLGNQGVILSGGGEPTISPNFEYAILEINGHPISFVEGCFLLGTDLYVAAPAGAPLLYGIVKVFHRAGVLPRLIIHSRHLPECRSRAAIPESPILHSQQYGGRIVGTVISMFPQSGIGNGNMISAAVHAASCGHRLPCPGGCRIIVKSIRLIFIHLIRLLRKAEILRHILPVAGGIYQHQR